MIFTCSETIKKKKNRPRITEGTRGKVLDRAETAYSVGLYEQSTLKFVKNYLTKLVNSSFLMFLENIKCENVSHKRKSCHCPCDTNHLESALFGKP